MDDPNHRAQRPKSTYSLMSWVNPRFTQMAQKLLADCSGARRTGLIKDTGYPAPIYVNSCPRRVNPSFKIEDLEGVL